MKSRFLLVLLVAALAGPLVARDDDSVAASIVEKVNAARLAAGVPTLPRDRVLDAAASRRALDTAGRPEHRRFDSDVPIDQLIRSEGKTRYQRAAQYLAYQGGYPDEAAAAVENWRAYETGWRQAMEPQWSSFGVATARASDGTLVICAVFLQDQPPAGDIGALERAVASAIDRERTERGLRPLAWDAALAAVAREHSEDMVRRHYFAHVSPDGVHPSQRVGKAGIPYIRLAENIAQNVRTTDPVARAVEGWMVSPGHRANILDPMFTRAGVGIAVDPGDGSFLFTQMFRRVAGDDDPAPADGAK